MARNDPTALRDEAAKAIERGKLDRAIEIYTELEALEPANPAWPKRLGETHRRNRKSAEAVTAFERAASKYAQGGFLVQAIAVCKLILQIDAQHSATLAMLVELAPSARPTTTPATPGPAPRAATSDPSPRAATNTPSPRAASEPGAPRAPAVRAATSDPSPRAASEPGTPRAPVVRAPTAGGIEQGVARSPVRAPTSSGIEQGVARSQPAPQPHAAVAPPAAMRPAAAAVPPAATRPPPPVPTRPPPIPSRQPQTTYPRTTAPSTPLRPAAPPLTAIPVAVPAGRALDALDLATVIPGSRRLQTKGGAWSGINVVPLDGPRTVDMRAPAMRIEVDAPSMGADVDGSSIRIEIDAPSLRLEGDEDHQELSLDGSQELSLGENQELSLDENQELSLDEHHELSLDDANDPRPRTAPVRAVLAATPLFSELPGAVLEMLVPRIKLLALEPGTVLFNEGDAGDCLYVVSEGEVSVASGGNELARLGPGSFFGEVSLVTDHPRSATVLAATPVELLAIDRDLVREAAAEQPEIVNVLLRFVRERLVDRMARTSSLFQSFTEGERASLVARFEFLEIASDVHLIVEGQRTDGLYVVVAGVVEVWRDGTTAPLAVLSSGDVFGEMALLGDGAATASCTTASRVIALRMPAPTFREVIMTHPQVLAYLAELEAARAPREDGDDVLGVHLEMM